MIGVLWYIGLYVALPLFFILFAGAMRTAMKRESTSASDLGVIEIVK